MKRENTFQSYIALSQNEPYNVSHSYIVVRWKFLFFVFCNKLHIYSEKLHCCQTTLHFLFYWVPISIAPITIAHWTISNLVTTVVSSFRQFVTQIKPEYIIDPLSWTAAKPHSTQSSPLSVSWFPPSSGVSSKRLLYFIHYSTLSPYSATVGVWEKIVSISIYTLLNYIVPSGEKKTSPKSIHNRLPACLHSN